MNKLHVLNPVCYPIKTVESVLLTELKHNLPNDRELRVGSLVGNVSHSCNHILTSFNNFVT